MIGVDGYFGKGFWLLFWVAVVVSGAFYIFSLFTQVLKIFAFGLRWKLPPFPDDGKPIY